METKHTPKQKRALEVIEFATGKVVHSVDVTGKSERHIEKAQMGMLRNMDLEHFGVRDTGSAEGR